MGHPASASITIVIGHETLKIMLMTFCGIRFRWSQRLCAVCVDATGDTSSFLFTVWLWIIFIFKCHIALAVIAILELLECYSKAKCTRAPAYSRVLRRINRVFQRVAHGKLKSDLQRVRGDSMENTSCRAANASGFIVNLPILWTSLRLYDCNGKSTIFTLANYRTYTLYVTLTLPLVSLRFPPLYKDFVNIDTWRQILMTSLYKGGNRKDSSHGVGSDEIYTLYVQKYAYYWYLM